LGNHFKIKFLIVGKRKKKSAGSKYKKVKKSDKSVDYKKAYEILKKQMKQMKRQTSNKRPKIVNKLIIKKRSDKYDIERPPNQPENSTSSNEENDQ
jgi:hypothetical protein